MSEQVDVVVVGAGPVGLLTAIELTLGGVRVLVLERLAAPSRVAKALGIGPLAVEALQRRGMAGAIAAAEARTLALMNRPAASAPGPRYTGHFAGLSLIRADAQKAPDRRGRPVDQPAVETMLGELVLSLGIELRRECDVTGFVQQAGGVDVAWSSPAGDGQVRCAWLVGCDGGRSRVRKMAGFAFPGTPPTLTMYQAVLDVDLPERLSPSGWRRTEAGVFSYGFLPRRLVMLDFSGPPADRDAPVAAAEIEAVLCRISGADVRVAALESASKWTDNTRLADSYRRGRVLLAGDAAHVHTPFGGQGMSLGLVDAANLGWKLAAVVRGEMPDSLLDTYTAERRPVAEAVLANTLAQAAIMRPDPQAGAMRELVAKLLQFDDVNRLIGEMTSGLSTRYELGSTRDEVGRLTADREIRHGNDKRSLYACMQDGRAVLLDASTDGKASQLVTASTQGIRCVSVDAGPSMLIRPDACVAWVGEGSGTAGLVEALRRWFVPALAEVSV